MQKQDRKPVPQTAAWAASLWSLVWLAHGICPYISDTFQIHSLPQASPQPLQAQGPSWACSMQLQCPRFGLTRQEKDFGLSPSLVTHQLCHLRLVNFFFLIFFYLLFIYHVYFWLCWVFVSV